MTLCQCGCGKPVPLATRTRNDRGHVRGQPIPFLKGHNISTKQRGEAHPQWKGGRKTMLAGYVAIYMPAHPRATNNYVSEHIVVAERALGRPLPAGAEPHHVNGQKGDNRPSNLVLCQDRAYHMLLHLRQRALDASGHADWRKCNFCKEYDDTTRLVVTTTTVYHKDCRAQYRNARYAEARA